MVSLVAFQGWVVIQNDCSSLASLSKELMLNDAPKIAEGGFKPPFSVWTMEVETVEKNSKMTCVWAGWICRGWLLESCQLPKKKSGVGESYMDENCIYNGKSLVSGILQWEVFNF